MIGSTSPRERMLIAVGAVAGLLVIGWTLGVQPIRDRLRGAADLVPAREQVLTRRLELLSRKASISRDLESTNARLQALGDRFLPGSTPAGIDR